MPRLTHWLKSQKMAKLVTKDVHHPFFSLKRRYLFESSCPTWWYTNYTLEHRSDLNPLDCTWNPRMPFECPQEELRYEPPNDTSVGYSTNIPLGPAWIQTWSRGWPLRDLVANLEAYQVGVHFEALNEGVLVAPLDSRYTQVGFNLISVQVWD